MMHPILKCVLANIATHALLVTGYVHYIPAPQPLTSDYYLWEFCGGLLLLGSDLFWTTTYFHRYAGHD